MFDKKLPQKWDEAADIIIVGSGFAGLAAAIEARANGASTIILEKAKGRGGNSIISEGFIAAAGSVFQKKQAIIDSPEQMARDMKKAGLGLNHPDLLAALVLCNTMDRPRPGGFGPNCFILSTALYPMAFLLPSTWA